MNEYFVGNTVIQRSDSLEGALGSIGVEPAEIVVADRIGLVRNVILPSNATLRFAPSGRLSLNGHSLIHNGRMVAVPNTIFDGPVTLNGPIPERYPEWWGAVGDGVTDDTVAVQNCLATGGSIRISKFYAISGTLTISPLTTIQGIGIGHCGFIQKTPNIPVLERTQVSPSNVNIRIQNLSIHPANGLITGVTGCSFVLCNSTHIEDVEFAGCAYSVVINQGIRHRLIHVLSNEYTDGVNTLKAGTTKIFSSDDSHYVFEVIVDGYVVLNTAIGVNDPALYLRRAVNVVVQNFLTNDLNLGGAVVGILVENDCQGVMISNPIVVAGTYGILFQTGAGIAASPYGCTVMGGGIDQCSVVGIQMTNGSHLKVLGVLGVSSGVATGAYGIIVGSGTERITVEGCDLRGWNTGAGTGILVGITSRVKILNNRITDCVTGIQTVIGAGDYIDISHNEASECTNPIIHGATGAHCLVTDNL